MFYGVREESMEKLIGTKQGIVKTRTIRRRAAPECTYPCMTLTLAGPNREKGGTLEPLPTRIPNAGGA